MALYPRLIDRIRRGRRRLPSSPRRRCLIKHQRNAHPDHVITLKFRLVDTVMIHLALGDGGGGFGGALEQI